MSVEQEIWNRILANNGMDTYAWGRLHNLLPAVGEMMEVNDSITLHVDRYGVRNNRRVAHHVPTRAELVGGTVKYRTLSVVAQGRPGGIRPDIEKWYKMRSHVTEMLTATRNSIREARSERAFIRPNIGEPLPLVRPDLSIEGMFNVLRTEKTQEVAVMRNSSEVTTAQNTMAFSGGTSYGKERFTVDPIIPVCLVAAKGRVEDVSEDIIVPSHKTVIEEQDGADDSDRKMSAVKKDKKQSKRLVVTEVARSENLDREPPDPGLESGSGNGVPIIVDEDDGAQSKQPDDGNGSKDVVV
jgi:hypothetical protein